MMEIPYLKTASATVASIVLILSAGFAADRNYVDEKELDIKVKAEMHVASEMIEKFIPEWKQQRIWDMEENVEKSESADERRRWMRRLRQLINALCKEYPDSPECAQDYLDYLRTEEGN